MVQSIESVQKTTDSLPMKPRNQRKRTSGGTPSQADSSPEKQAKHSAETTPPDDGSCTPIHESGKIPVILANNRKNFSEAADSQPPKSCDIDIQCAKLNGRSTVMEPKTNNDEIPLLENSPLLQRTKLRIIDSDSIDDYLHGGNNSQEQEEELLQYFQQGESDVETGSIIPPITDLSSSRSDKVSELRFILQQNLKATTRSVTNQTTSTPVNIPIKQEEKHANPTTTNVNNIRRRVSFETSVIEHDSITTSSHTVPQSPNTRRRIFNFTPISPGPHSPINGRASKCNSANASPFVSPRNTPVPRSKSNLQNGYRSRSAKKTLSRSISCNVPYTNKNETFVVPENTRQVARSPLVLTKTSDTQVRNQLLKDCSGFPSIEPQKMIGNYQDNQDNLRVHREVHLEINQEINHEVNHEANHEVNQVNHEVNLEPNQEVKVKNIYKTQSDQEISELLNDGKQKLEVTQQTKELYSRSQSVPLYRMVNPTLISPVSTTQFLTPFLSFNPSTSSSIAPTPVPSEFTDFYSIDAPDDAMYLLEDANFMSDDHQQFLMNDKEMSSENINNFLNILNEEQEILSHNGQGVMETSSLILDSLPNSYLNITNDSGIDAGIVIENTSLQKMIQSRSYPNTPLPMPITSACALPFTEDSSGASRSYPTTPLHSVQAREQYSESNEPMLSSPTIDTLNLRGDVTATNSSESVCQSVADFLEPSFLDNVQNGDLDGLDSFEGLQDTLPPLFNEVVEPNR